MSDEAKRYLINLRAKGGKGPRSIEISEKDYNRIATSLLTMGQPGNAGGRIVVHEKLENGERTHFLGSSEITSIDELNDDGPFV